MNGTFYVTKELAVSGVPPLAYAARSSSLSRFDLTDQPINVPTTDQSTNQR